MKKKSILFTCIVAIMALAMFVGCDNAPTLPSFVVGGTINQTGDFLEGQAFDPSKFTVTITYDNGRIVAADETVSVYLDTDKGAVGKVNVGDTVKADLGKNFADSDICATAAVKVYNIKSIAVTGPESYAYERDNLDIVPASDLTVTATYLDSENAEKTMVLVPGEYNVGKIPSTVTVSPSAPSVVTSVTVTALVGNFDSTNKIKEDFSFTLTYGEPVTEFVDIASVELKESSVMAALDYETLPVPSFDDVTIMVNTANSSDPAQLVVEPEGLRLFYYDTATKLEVNETSFVDGKTLAAGVEYNGAKTLQNVSDTESKKVVTIETATVELTATKAYDFSGFVRGEALPAVDAENIIATLKVGNEYQEIEDPSAVVYKYYNATSSSEITDGKVPAKGAIYIGAEYLGAKPGNSIINVPEKAMIDEASTSYVWPGVSFFKTAETYTAPAKQYYDDINDVISALSVEDLVFTPFSVDGKEITVDPASVEVYYSTTNSDLTGGTAVGSTSAISGSKLSTTALTDSKYDSDNGNSSLTGENVYIVAEYPVFDAKTNKTTIYVASVVVDLEEPVVENTELVLSYADTKEDEIPLVGKAVKFAIKTSNADGLIALVEDNAANKKTYTLLVDGEAVADWSTVKVEEKQQNVVLYETANSTKNVKAVIPAGRDFVTNSNTIEVELVTDKVLIEGTDITDNEYVEFTADDFKATATFTVAGEDQEIEIVGIEIPESLKATGISYSVPVRVQYTDSTGAVVTKVVGAAVPVVEDYPVAFVATPSRDIIAGLRLSYNYFNFAVTKWASNPNVEVEPVPIAEAGIAKSEITVDDDSKIAGPAGEVQTVNMTWTPAEEAIKGKTVAITGTITPVADYPTRITAGTDGSVSVNVNSTFGDEAFGFNVTWASGLKYGEGGTTTAEAPEIDYKYTCAELNAENADSLSVGGANTYTVLVSWTCGEYSSESPISVSLSVN